MNEALGSFLDETLLEATGSEGYVLDFEPVEAKSNVSGLVRVMKDERTKNPSGQ